MDSSIILKDFLVSRSSLEDCLTFDQFSKLLKGQSYDTIRQLYADLSEQRRAILNQVDQQVEKEFDIPLEGVQISMNPDLKQLGKLNLSDLLLKLYSLRETIVSENSLLDTQVNGMLSQLETTIDNLSNLRFGNSWIRGGDNSEVETIVQNSIESIKKCETYVKRRRIQNQLIE